MRAEKRKVLLQAALFSTGSAYICFGLPFTSRRMNSVDVSPGLSVIPFTNGTSMSAHPASNPILGR